MPLRNWILPALLPLFAGCGGGSGSPASPPAVDATVSIDNTDAAILAAPPVNRRLLGSNLEWISGGDDILTAGTSIFATAPLANAATLAPTVIRYPGGSLADAYQWLPGVATTPRGQEVNIYSGQPETVYFGTNEFLSLCQQVGASPLITLNVVTAAPSDSAAWVAYTNGSPPSGSPPVVPDWEVGNEPYYLNGIGSAYTVTAAQYAAAYDAHVSAVLAADPRVRVGLCLVGALDAPLLSSDRLTWNADVLGAITQPVDFVAIHDAYLPVLYNYSSANPPTSQQLLSALLASAPAVDADLDRVRSQLAQAGITAPFALTEHNALGTLLGGLNPVPVTDGIPSSLAGAVYTADLICTLAKRDDVDMADHWSLVGDWVFGAMDFNGAARPTYYTLLGLGRAFTGRRVPTTVAGPTADEAPLGLLPAQAAMPLVSAFTAGSGGQLRCVLVNRSPASDLQVRLACLNGATGAPASVFTLDAADPLQSFLYGLPSATPPGWVETSAAADAGGATITLPAHSLVIVELPAPTAGI